MAEKKTKKSSKTLSVSGKKEKKTTDEKKELSIKQRKTYADKQQFYAIIFISVAILLSCFAFIKGENIWAYARGVLFAFLGVGFFVLIILMFFIGILAAKNKFRKSPGWFVGCSMTLTGFISSFVHVIVNTQADGQWWSQFKDAVTIGWKVSSEGLHLTGGILGALVGGLFLNGFGKTAAIVTLIVLITANVMLLTGLTFSIIDKSIHDTARKVREKNAERRETRKLEKEDMLRRAEEQRLRDEEERRRQEEIRARALAEKKPEDIFGANNSRLSNEKTNVNYSDPFSPTQDEISQIIDNADRTNMANIDDPIANSSNPNFKFTNPVTDPAVNFYLRDKLEKEEKETEHKQIESIVEESVDELKDNHQYALSEAGNDDIFDATIQDAKDAENKKQAVIASAENIPAKNKSGYKLPSETLLNDPKKNTDFDFKNEMRNISEKLTDTLKSFGVETNLVGISRGPSVTRYELQPAPGVKISRITNLSDDIALALATSGVRIEAPIPNKSAVGIEVPNKSRSTVTFKEIIKSDVFQSDKEKSKLTVALGKDISGNVNCADLSKMPHLLIAGTTGSGKSVCLNGMIASILYNATPTEVKFLMIDPKKVEFSVYNGIPHLLVPVISEVRKAAGALAWAVSEMENRYKAFSEYAVRDIFSFNKYCETHPELTKMHQIVIFIDELNDLMMVSPKEVEDSICRIAQKARAAGIHLVIATQRPSVDVITGLIKANVPSRLSLSVSSQVDSRTVLDLIGAEKLLGNGDMLFKPVGVNKPTRIQGAYLSDDEIERIVNSIKKQGDAEYDEEISEDIERLATVENTKKTSDKDSDSDDERDEMFEQAVEVVVDLGQASTTLLQRKLKLGYARAARVMDQLEQGGIVGPSEGAKPRKVLITKEQLLEMKAYAEG